MILMKYALNKKNQPWFKNFRKALKIAHINFSKKIELRGNFFKFQHIYANNKLPNVYSG